MINVPEKEQFLSDKVVDYEEAQRRIERVAGKIGLCHGGYDILHPGHIKHLESAKSLCDFLIVSVTSDRFVSKRKGFGRPVIPQSLRAYSVASLSFTDLVVISDFERGTDVIKILRPNYYIKGPDFANKSTPGIEAERAAILDVGGEMRYTNDPALSTTSIIRYIKEELDRKKILLVIDRDGTLIDDKIFIGSKDNWMSDISVKKDVVDFLIKIQTRYETTSLVVSNQAGVARGMFDTARVEEINNYLSRTLKKSGLRIDDWQYCPDVDRAYALSSGLLFNPAYVKEKTERKPSLAMVSKSLEKLGRTLEDMACVLVIGDRAEDEGLARNLNARFIDVNGKSLADLEQEVQYLELL